MRPTSAPHRKTGVPWFFGMGSAGDKRRPLGIYLGELLGTWEVWGKAVVWECLSQNGHRSYCGD